MIRRTGGFRTGPVWRRCCAPPASRSYSILKKKYISASGGLPVLEAVMLWNEPNNLSHWNFELDRDWTIYAEMTKLAADAVKAENSKLRRVLGGISPIDPEFIRNMQRQCVLRRVN